MPGSEAPDHSRFNVTLLLNEVHRDTTCTAGCANVSLTDGVLAQHPGVAFIPDLQTILDTWFNDAMNKRVYEHSSGLAELAWKRKGVFYAARRPVSVATFD